MTEVSPEAARKLEEMAEVVGELFDERVMEQVSDIAADLAYEFDARRKRLEDKRALSDGGLFEEFTDEDEDRVMAIDSEWESRLLATFATGLLRREGRSELFVPPWTRMSRVEVAWPDEATQDA